jgi:hypothetical protein
MKCCWMQREKPVIGVRKLRSSAGFYYEQRGLSEPPPCALSGRLVVSDVNKLEKWRHEVTIPTNAMALFLLWPHLALSFHLNYNLESCAIVATNNNAPVLSLLKFINACLDNALRSPRQHTLIRQSLMLVTLRGDALSLDRARGIIS